MINKENTGMSRRNVLKALVAGTIAAAGGLALGSRAALRWQRAHQGPSWPGRKPRPAMRLSRSRLIKACSRSRVLISN